MYHQLAPLGLSPGTPATQSNRSSFEYYEDAQSPQSSVCVRSTKSEDPVFTRGELVESMKSISKFALHYAAVYHSIGLSYHSLPFSARQSQWVVEDLRFKVEDALCTSVYKRLPDLIYIFTEISHRLNNAQFFLVRGTQWQGAETQLRRCDDLLQEAELRLRFLQSGVGNMWFTVGRDNAVTWTEGKAYARARRTLEKRWLSVLPQMCFADPAQSQASRDEQHEREFWSQLEAIN